MIIAPLSASALVALTLAAGEIHVLNLLGEDHVFDWAETRDEIDPERSGVIGFRHSGIHAALPATQEPRVPFLAMTFLAMTPLGFNWMRDAV
jgi:hypothetical protein